MAAALQLSRNAIFPSFRSLLPTGFVFASMTAPQAATWSIPSLQSLLDLFPPFLLAVPKSKVSHSRKAMRSANKGLKDKRNIVHCPACGQAKLAHHQCSICYSFLSRMWKSKQKQNDIPDMS